MKNIHIPKIIHYCWFGRGKMSDLMLQCIESWRNFMPDFEIKRWDESNFDVYATVYTSEAYEARKFAFVSDYARCKILYEYGGIYLDTDVELLRSLAPLIEMGSYFGCERSGKEKLGVAPGLGMAVIPRHPILKEYLNLYENIQFIINGKPHPKNIVHFSMEILEKYGIRYIDTIQLLKIPSKENIGVVPLTILPKEYLCPMDYETGELKITANTFSIHHYSYSWADECSRKVIRRKQWIFKHFPRSIAQSVFNVYNHLCTYCGF